MSKVFVPYVNKVSEKMYEVEFLPSVVQGLAPLCHAFKSGQSRENILSDVGKRHRLAALIGASPSTIHLHHAKKARDDIIFSRGRGQAHVQLLRHALQVNDAESAQRKAEIGQLLD